MYFGLLNTLFSLKVPMLDTASDSRVARVNLFRGVRLWKGLVLVTV